MALERSRTRFAAFLVPITAFVVPFAAVACASDAPPAASASLGTPEAPTDAESLTPLRLREEQRIGSVDDPAYGFSRIGSVEVDEHGQLHVFESFDHEIRVYAPDGSLVRRIGREGDGPGEFRGEDVRFGFAGDTLWAADPHPRARRLTYFDRTGAVLSTARFDDVRLQLHSPAERTYIAPATLGADGLFHGARAPVLGVAASSTADASGRPLRAAAPAAQIEVPRVRFGKNGHVVDTLATYVIPFRSPVSGSVEVGRSRYWVPAAPSFEPLRVEETTGQILIGREPATAGEGGTFTVTRTSFDGNTLQDRTFGYRPRPFPPALLESIAATASRGEGQASRVTEEGIVALRRFREDSADGHRAIRAALQFPEFQPPVQGFWLGNDDALWLRREDDAVDTFRWTVLDPELRPVGELALPKGFQPVWGRADQVWAVETDALGVPWLVRYSIEPAG